MNEAAEQPPLVIAFDTLADARNQMIGFCWPADKTPQIVKMLHVPSGKFIHWNTSILMSNPIYDLVWMLRNNFTVFHGDVFLQEKK